ncbi:MAG: TonB-dependent receptor [Bacteroidota bacterium]|nr:TonB-dependent receptor [Bacteroidota bacterium]MDP4235565.1 TonB-dependent receptor [Bacteroidota bacterium]
MFLRYPYCICALVLFAGTSFGQVQVTDDSLRHTTAPPITVTSDRGDEMIAIHPADIHVETGQELSKRTGASRISEALAILHPSLDIRNYGSLGGISLASFRGLPAEYTSVYWEGIKITNSQNSVTDLALIDLSSIRSVGIVSAANSQLIAGDIGGAGILLKTDATLAQSGIGIGTSTTSFDDFSSLGEKEIKLDAKAMILDSLAVSGDLSSAYSDGAFPFYQRSTGNTIRRENNDAHLLNANAAADYILDETASVKAFSYFSRAERGAPGSVTIDNRGASSFNARQYDEDFLGALSLKHIPLPNFEYSVSLGYQSQYETYDLPTYKVADQYLNRIYSFILKTKTLIADWSDLCSGVDYTKNLLFSNENSISKTDTSVLRESYAAYMAFNARFLDHFDATASLRAELLSDINVSQTLPGISLHYSEPKTLLTLEASYGMLYHAPTFNELYWRTGGNLALHPETGMSTEFSASIPVTLSKAVTANFQLGLYRTQMNDQIIWQPVPNSIYWSPSNVKSSRSEGIELTGELEYLLGRSYKLLVRESFTRGSAINLDTDSSYYGKELPYSTPERSVFLLELSNTSIGSLAFTTLYRWHRYTDFYNNESTRLPPVTRIDITFSSAPLRMGSIGQAILRLSALNLTNVQYEEVPSYPLPGRMIRLSLDLHFL